MKNVRVMAIAILLVLVAAVPSFAQMRSVKVDVPFEFQVGNTVLPAGSYQLSQVAGTALFIENAKGSGGAVSLTSATGGSGDARQPHLTFHKYGQRYFLTETWLRYSNAGQKLPAAAAEIEMVHNGHNTTRVLIALK